MSTWWEILTRRKHFPTSENLNQSDDFTTNTNKLARVLSTFDLTALGVGSTLGVGVYVLAGHVAKDTAGPAVVLSFLIAAIASVFAGLCYAEFGARVPRAGSAYIYSYVCVGELVAFIIGWNLILEYVIGSASVAKGLSVYLDTLLNNTLRNSFTEICPMHSSFTAEYFDLLSFSITIVLGVALTFGMKESSIVNNIFTITNIGVVIFVIIAGSINADSQNWNINKEDIPSDINGGNGGFMPFGIEGVIKGAATCFYGFVGFDCIATTGEEVKNPKRAIPLSIIISLFIIFICYFSTSAIITMMVPYYLQDSDAPIPHAFSEIGWYWAKWIVSIGGIFGLITSLFGAMFPLPRIIYAMANDSLIFRFLGNVNSRFKTPAVGTLLASLLTGLMSSIFNLKQLVNMMSIGTLLAYTIVAACTIILRHSKNNHEIKNWKYSLLKTRLDSDEEFSEDEQKYEYTENLNLIPPQPEMTLKTISKQMFNFSQKSPSSFSQKLVTILVFIYGILCFVLAALISLLQNDLMNGNLEAVIPIVIIVAFMLVVLLSISAQPTEKPSSSFKVPLVPLIPALSICINIYLMLMLDRHTWIRFGIWMAIGIPIYLTSCKLYKKIEKSKPSTNGHINHTFVPDNLQNGSVHTIPKIVVDPPSFNKLNEKWDCDESETNMDDIRERTASINSNDLTNAVLEIDKVLNDSENQIIDNFEAINPDNDHKNESVLSKSLDNDSITSSHSNQMDTLSICSSHSGSVHSKEHHVEAQIHQENDQNTNTENDIFIADTNKNQNKEEENKNTPVEKAENILEREDNQNKSDILIADTSKKEEEEENKDSPMEENHIPKPPPISGLVIDPILIPPRHTLKITSKDLKNVALKQAPQPMKRTLITKSNEQTENVKSGSVQYENIKSKLNKILSNCPLVLPANKKPIIEDQTSSLVIEKEIKELDQVLEEYDIDNTDIPVGFGRTKEFKDKLNSILMRRNSNDMRKPAKTYEKINIDNNSITNEEQEEINKQDHKKQMNATLRKIQLKRQGLIKDDTEETEENNKNDVPNKYESTMEKDKAEHKRLMVKSLRQIKLRKTGLLFNTDYTEQEENANKDETVDAPKVEQSTVNKDREKHKRLMIQTLRHINLRKTGRSLNEDNIENKYTDIPR